MTGAARSRGRRLWIAGLLAALLIAGGLSYLASPSPDGLEAATLRGCVVSRVDPDVDPERAGTGELTGDCIARSAHEHPLADSPLADYAVGGATGSGGLAGVAGVVVTLALAAGMFRVLGRGGR